MASFGAASDNWRVAIRRGMLWVLAVKLGLLTLLWAICFSPSHRYPVTALATGQHLAVDGTRANAAGTQDRKETARE
jgi:hypothetical protein